MLKLLIQTTGWLVAHTPECVLRGATVILAEAVLLLRRRLILSNLHHAFPDWSEAARRATARQSCRRMVETGLLSLATPFIPLPRLRKIITNTAAMNALVAAQQSTPQPHVLVTPHFAYWEAVTCFPIAVPNLANHFAARETATREDTASASKRTDDQRETATSTTTRTYDQREYAKEKETRRLPEFAAIYRPLKNPALDAWLKNTRERYGIKLLSRKKGFQEAIAILRRGGAVSILFDQNAGDIGALTTLLGRVCSTTELPGLLAQKFSAPVVAVYAMRRAFWRIEVQAETVLPASGASSEAVTLALNRWLEERLKNNANACASWLWAHARWKNQNSPDRRLRFTAKRNLLAADLAARASNSSSKGDSATEQSPSAADSRIATPTAAAHADTLTGKAELPLSSSPPAPQLTLLPRRTRLWVRLPNWLGDVVMLVPLLRALRLSRPDAELTLIGKAQFAPLIEDHALADRFIPLPPRSANGLAYFSAFWRLRRQYPDTLLLFTNSARGDIEGWLTRSPQRFGIARSGKPRPLLTHRFALPPDYDEAQHHQLDLWCDFLRHFGLELPPDRTPLGAVISRAKAAAPPPRLGLIVGSENAPEKRWPIPHWIALIQSLPRELPITLFGTAKDRALTSEIVARCQVSTPPRPLENLAGQTDLRQYCARLRDCAALVTNDTGGMHLANALGVPLVALFGPTNPRRTGPVFAAPVTILQPPDCPPTGGGAGGALAALPPEQVRAALAPLINCAPPGNEAGPPERPALTCPPACPHSPRRTHTPSRTARSMPSPLLRVQNLRTYFHTRSGVYRAVDGVSFDLHAGEALGIVGESGSGKSVTCYSLLRLVPQPPGRIESGSAVFDGTDLLRCSEAQMRAIRGKRISMIFQDPMTSLNPFMRIGAQIMEPLLIHEKISKKEARARALDMLRAVGIDDAEARLRAYPHEFSGGMRQRVMIAMALITRPDILIADEPTTALDVTVQAQILEIIGQMQRELGMAVIFITHDLAVVSQLCNRTQVMYAGRIVESAPTRQLFQAPEHPYTRALQRCIPALQPKGRELYAIPGMPPDLSKPLSEEQLLARFRDVPEPRENAAARTAPSAPREQTGSPNESANWPREPTGGQRREPATPELANERVERQRAINEPKALPALELRDIKTHFRTGGSFLRRSRSEPIKAVDGVSLQIRQGEVLGLVGESGSGKSTLSRTIMQLVPATSGSVIFEGRNLSTSHARDIHATRRSLQMVFQDPYASLNPRMTVFDALAEPLRVHKICPPTEVAARVAQLMETVGLAPRFLRKYPHEFSGGQRQRIAIARALALEPRVIIADEPVSALDVSIQAQILNLLSRLVRERHLTMIFIAHDLSVVKHISDRIAVMYRGQIVELGDATEIMERPQHPYTQRLIRAIPSLVGSPAAAPAN